MANELLDDYEQAEQVKKWLQENGGAIILGVTLGIGGLLGYQYWGKYQTQQRLAAATAFADLNRELADGNVVDDGVVERFESAYGDSAYTAFAAMRLAGQAAEDGDIDAAITHLRKAAGIAQPPALASIAKLRLARLLIAKGSPDDAIAQLGQVGADFSALASEIRGDALLAKGDQVGAWEAYDAALNDPNISPQSTYLVQLKRDDIAPASSVES